MHFMCLQYLIFMCAAQRIHERVATPPTRRAVQERAFADEDAKHVVCPKVMIISTYAPEANVWYRDQSLNLFAQNITVEGLSPIWPDVHCSSDGQTCQVTTGLGVVNAASSINALWLSSRFDLRYTYFLIAAIAGINPHEATTSSVTFAQYVVNLDIQYAASPLEISSNYTSGYLPLGAYTSDSTDTAAYPTSIFGWEVFELNADLMFRAASVARQVKLSDSTTAAQYRAQYDYAPANKAPGVFLCASGVSNIYWTGALDGYAFQNYTKLMTNGSATYCATNTEDSGIHEALLRGHLANKLDYSRVINMRTASDFDRAPPGTDTLFHLLYATQGAYDSSLENIYLVGVEIVKDVISHWEDVYKRGIKPGNYIGDLFGSIKGQSARRDIGPPTLPEDAMTY